MGDFASLCCWRAVNSSLLLACFRLGLRGEGRFVAFAIALALSVFAAVFVLSAVFFIETGCFRFAAPSPGIARCYWIFAKRRDPTLFFRWKKIKDRAEGFR